MPSPFLQASSKPGCGQVRLSLLPPSTPTYSTLNFTYPLKLLPSAPHKPSPSLSSVHQNAISSSKSVSTEDARNSVRSNVEYRDGDNQESIRRPSIVPLLFILTYGGGLLAGDVTALDITLEAGTRLTAATQGMTRIYAPPIASPFSNHTRESNPTTPVTSQSICANMHRHSALWLSPDPVQPFAGSASTQTQRFHLHHSSASIGLIDWVCEGRKSRGESWVLDMWRSKNEIWMHTGEINQTENVGQQSIERLLIRDTIILNGQKNKSNRVAGMMDGKGIFGSLLLYGPVFEPLARFFSEEFEATERIGGKNWDSTPATSEGDSEAVSSSNTNAKDMQDRFTWRRQRQNTEKIDGVLWTATRLANRGGIAIVKFSAAEAEGARQWLGGMLRQEGTIAREFGEGGLMFVR